MKRGVGPPDPPTVLTLQSMFDSWRADAYASRAPLQ